MQILNKLLPLINLKKILSMIFIAILLNTLLFLPTYLMWIQYADNIQTHLADLVLTLSIIILIFTAATLILKKIYCNFFLKIIIISVLIGIFNLYYIALVVGIKNWGNVINYEIVFSYYKLMFSNNEQLLLIVYIFIFVVTSALFSFSIIVFCLKKIKYYAINKSTINHILLFILLASLVSIAFTIKSGSQSPILLFFDDSKKLKRMQTYLIPEQKFEQLKTVHEIERKLYFKQPQQKNTLNKTDTVILFTVDALRYDRTSIANYTRNTTPYLKSLLNKNLFDHGPVRANCSESMCGLVSLLSASTSDNIYPNAINLYEILNYNGFSTHAVLSGQHANFYSLGEIYKQAHTFIDGSKIDDVSNSNNDDFLLNYIDKLSLEPDRPHFFHIHLMSVHGLGVRDKRYAKWLPQESYYTYPFTQKWKEKQPLFNNYYDNGVLQADDLIKTIRNKIMSKLNINKVKTIITADHGELLGEHGMYSHSRKLYDVVLNVPLYFIDYPNNVLKRKITQFDIAPTILHDLNIPLPKTFSGIPAQLPATRDYTIHSILADIALVNSNNVKWMYNAKTNLIEIYNLNTDPNELHNIVDIYPEAEKKLFLDYFKQKYPFFDTVYNK